MDPTGLPTQQMQDDMEKLMQMFPDREALMQMLNNLNKTLPSAAQPNQTPEQQKKMNRKVLNDGKRAKANLPIYTQQDRIMTEIKENEFTIVVGETGCGKSTQLPQYLFEEYEDKKNAKILWVLPRKLAVLTLAERVCKEMDITLGREIGYEVPAKCKTSPETILKFVTDTVLIKELIEKRKRAPHGKKLKLNYSVVVLDEVHERNLYTDILLATLKDIATESNLKLVVTSATINEEVFENYFNTKPIYVKGRPFPVEVEYSPVPETSSHLIHMLNKIYEVTRRMESKGFEYEGHVLLFTSGVDDITKLIIKLEEEKEINLKKFEVLPLHGLLSSEDQQAIFRDAGKIKIILSTRMAETALTINGVRIVIDVGIDKENRYDPVKRMTLTETRPIPKSSAIQRAGRAGRTEKGLCIRLYSQEDFDRMIPNKVPEIQRMNLGKVVLKLKALGVVDVREFDFVEKPSKDVLNQTVEHLKGLGALDSQDESLTHIGEAMLKLETDPEFSRVIFEGYYRDCANEVMIIIAMIGVSSRLYYRGLQDETKEKADKMKYPFCHESGDLLTFLNIFVKWINQPNGKRREWCNKYCFNPAAIKDANKAFNELWNGLKDARELLDQSLEKAKKNGNQAQAEEQKIEELNEEEEKQEARDLANQDLLKIEESIIKCFLSAFFPNICKYSDIPRLGYILLRNEMTVKIHGSSSLALVQEYPQYLICIDINKTSYNHSRVVSFIKQKWIEDVFPNYKENPTLAFLTKKLSFHSYKHSGLGRSILTAFAYPSIPEIAALQENGDHTCFVDWREEAIYLDSARKTDEELENTAKRLIEKAKDELRRDTREVVMTSKTRGVFSIGASVQTVLLDSETLSLAFNNFDAVWDPVSIKKELSQIAEVSNVISEIDPVSTLRQGKIRTLSVEDTKKIAHHYNEYRLKAFESECVTQETQPSLVPIPFRVTNGKKACRAKIEWSVGMSKKEGALYFSSNIAAEEAAKMISHEGFMIDGNDLKVKQVKNKAVHLQNLHWITDEINIERELICRGMDKELVGTKVFRKHDFGSNFENLESEDYVDKIRDEIIKVLGINQNEIVRIEAYKPREKTEDEEDYRKYRRSVDIDLYELDVARAIEKHFDQKTNFGDLTEGRVHCTLTFTKRLQVKWFKYRQIEVELKTILEQIKADKGNLVKIFEEKRENENTGRGNTKSRDVGIRLITRDLLTMDQCLLLIDPIVNGIPVFLKTYSQIRKANSEKTNQKINILSEKYKVSIDYDKKMRLFRIMGTQENRKLAHKELSEFLSPVGDGTEKMQARVSFKHKPIRHILEKGGVLLAQIEEKNSVSIALSLVYKEFIIIGNAKNLPIAESQLKELINKSSKDKEGECPICEGSFVEGYRLQMCGHKFCSDCLELYLDTELQDANFPICCPKCLEGDHEEPICLRDLYNILTSVEMRKLWAKSLSSYLRKNTEQYFRCYSPNCPQFFRVSEQNWFDCDYCFRSYCKTCQRKGHGDNPCAVFCERCQKEGHKEGDCDDLVKAEILKALKKEEVEVEVRECPYCKMIIQKVGGCSHMKCEFCKQNFDWD